MAYQKHASINTACPAPAALQAIVFDMGSFNASYEGRSLRLTFFNKAFGPVRQAAAAVTVRAWAAARHTADLLHDLCGRWWGHQACLQLPPCTPPALARLPRMAHPNPQHCHVPPLVRL